MRCRTDRLALIALRNQLQLLCEHMIDHVHVVAQLSVQFTSTMRAALAVYYVGATRGKITNVPREHSQFECLLSGEPHAGDG